MTVLAFPAIQAATVDWQFATVTKNHASPFTGDEQTEANPGAPKWVAVLTWKLLSRAEAADLEAFLVECDGPAGRFYLTNQARKAPRGTPLGTPVVDGAANYGGLLATRGWTPNSVGILLRGDYFAVNYEPKMLLADASADAGGLATLRFKPNLRAVPADGTAIVTTSPSGIFRLLDDNQAKFAYRKQTGDYQITCVETWQL